MNVATNLKILKVICFIAFFIYTLYYLEGSKYVFKNVLVENGYKPKKLLGSSFIYYIISPVTYYGNSSVKNTSLSSFQEHQNKMTRLVDHLTSLLEHTGLRTMTPLRTVSEDRCSSPFVTILDTGRLGNKICQLMTLIMFRKYFGIRIAISDYMFTNLENLFANLSVPKLPNRCFEERQNSFFVGDPIILEKILFTRLVREEEGENVTYNNETYSTDIKHYNYIFSHSCPFLPHFPQDRKFIHEKLRIKELYIAKAKERIKYVLSERNLKREDITLVSVHVRRTDYVRYMKMKHLELPSHIYYKNAMHLFRIRCSPILFLVVSDDMEWIVQFLSGPDVAFPGTSNITSPELDFTIITLCDHHIAGPGTFSYTSALLGTGTIARYTYNFKNSLHKVRDPSFGCNFPDGIIRLTE